MQTHVEFRSDRFPAHEGEEDQINPDVWGKRLAEFLCEKLLTEGFRTEEPLAEDWGWRIDVINDDFSLWIGYGSAAADTKNIPTDIFASSNHTRLMFADSSERSIRENASARFNER